MAFKKTENNNSTGFNYEVVEELGNFGKVDRKGFQWKLRLIKWNGRDARYDIRSWGTDEDDNEVMRKGISMDGETLEALTELLVKVRGAE